MAKDHKMSQQEIDLVLAGSEESKAMDDALKRLIPWQEYVDGSMLSLKDKGCILDYLEAAKSQQDDLDSMLEERGETIALVFVNALSQLHDRNTVQFLLAHTYQLLIGNPYRAQHFHALVKSAFNPYAPFLRCAKMSDDPFSINKANQILALLFSKGGTGDVPDMAEFLKLLLDRLAKARGNEVLLVLRGVKDVLKNPEARPIFLQLSGLNCLTLYFRSTNQNMQTLYVAGFCVWLLSYDKGRLQGLKDWDVINKINEILKLVIPEKIVRISYSILSNLLDQMAFNEEMISVGLAKQTDSLMSRKFKDDDLVVEMERVKRVLDEAIISLSSFEKYAAEVQSAKLEWTPVHSPQFWRENSTKFETNSYALIKQLIGLLATGDELTIEVACYDLGEFARFHPDGKKIIQSNNGKAYLMQRMSHKNPQISRQALTAVQKLMVTNWEFLEKSSVPSKSSSSSASASSSSSSSS